MHNKLITIVGNVATGKSTLVHMLADALPAKLVPADELYKTNPFFPLAIEDRIRWSFASDIWFLKERTKMAQEFDQELQDSHVVVDSGLPMTQVYTHSRLGQGYFTEDEWQLYQDCYRVFTKECRQTDVLIYLTATLDVQLERIKDRGREFEIKNHSREYLAGLSESLEHVVEEHRAQNIPVIEIDTTKVNFLNNEDALPQLIDQIMEVCRG